MFVRIGSREHFLITYILFLPKHTLTERYHYIELVKEDQDMSKKELYS